MNRIIISFLGIVFPFAISAQITGTVFGVDENGEEPLIGAYVIWAGTNYGTTTDVNGSFSITQHNNHTKLAISFVGYQTDTVEASAQPMVIKLKQLELDEVDVVARRTGSSLSRISAITTVNLTSDELCKAACCNLGESFETNASVDVSYADAATGARTIQLLGLSGRYVQMLTENVPNMRGISQPFGLSYVPGSWMNGIQISKGVGTVVNGYEAFTGQINVDYKKSVTDEVASVNLFGSSSGRTEANATTAFHVAEGLSTALLISASKDNMTMDENNDHFRDEPEVKQLNFMNRWNYHKGIWTSQLVVKTLNEQRMGGQTNFNQKTPSADKYGVYIGTDRVETWLKNGFEIGEESNLGTAFSYIYHNQSSVFGLKQYNATQHSYTGNIIFQNEWHPYHTLHAGISSYGDFVNEHINFDDTTQNRYKLTDYTIGAFAQYTLKIDELLTIVAGLRTDWSNLYNVFVTPRLHIRYSPSENTIIRAAIGKGYRTGMLFAENNYMLSSARKWEYTNVYGQETAWNMGANITQYIHIFEKELMLNAEFYHTEFGSQMVTDMDYSPRTLIATFSDKRSFANIFQIEGKISPLRGLELTGAWRWNDAQQTTGGSLQQRPLVSRHKGLITATYSTPLKKWQFDANVQFNGGGRIPTTMGNPEEYQRSNKFEAYQMFNAQITKWFRTWSIYAGCENIGNFTQKNPIIAANNPQSQYFDGTMVWGPLMSRKFYVGLRWSLEKDDNQ